MRNRVEELARSFERFPGIGPRQAKRFVYHLLGAGRDDRSRIADLIAHLADDVRQCADCRRYAQFSGTLCQYCSDRMRDDTVLMIIEKDQDLEAVERTNAYRGRYFVLGGALTLSGKGIIRQQDLLSLVKRKLDTGLSEIVFALSATSEGEHTVDHLRDVLTPLRPHLKLSVLGRGLSTGSELEYADSPTLSAAFLNRKEM